MRVVVIAALVVIGVLLVAAAGAAAAFFWTIRRRAVGPDARKMADDPTLHITIDDATPGMIVARTGFEGGVMPAMANRTSEAYRAWTLKTADWESALLAAVDAVDEHQVTWRHLACSIRHVAFHGEKSVAVGRALVPASVVVRAHGIDRLGLLVRLTVCLTSTGEGHSGRVVRQPATIGECPPAMAAAFSALSEDGAPEG